VGNRLSQVLCFCLQASHGASVSFSQFVSGFESNPKQDQVETEPV